MARIRTVKPEFWSDSKTGTLSDRATKLFIGMLNFSDDYGVLEFDTESLKARIFPYEKLGHMEVVVPALLDELLPKGLISLFSYQQDENSTIKKYLFVRNFQKHQKVDKPGKPLIPSWERGDTPESFQERQTGFAEHSENIPRTFAEHSETIRCGKGREGKGERKDYPPTESGEEYVSRVKKFYDEIPEEQIQDWETRYSDAVNVNSALFTATTWLVDNPTRRKKDLKKFYGNWLRNQYQRATQPRQSYGK